MRADDKKPPYQYSERSVELAILSIAREQEGSFLNLPLRWLPTHGLPVVMTKAFHSLLMGSDGSYGLRSAGNASGLPSAGSPVSISMDCIPFAKSWVAAFGFGARYFASSDGEARLTERPFSNTAFRCFGVSPMPRLSSRLRLLDLVLRPEESESLLRSG